MKVDLKRILNYESSAPSGNKIVMVDAINHALARRDGKEFRDVHLWRRY